MRPWEGKRLMCREYIQYFFYLDKTIESIELVKAEG